MIPIGDESYKMVIYRTQGRAMLQQNSFTSDSRVVIKWSSSCHQMVAKKRCHQVASDCSGSGRKTQSSQSENVTDLVRPPTHCIVCVLETILTFSIIHIVLF